MLIDSINLNHLRIFESVYRNKSMTLAAKELHLTQSGISQHVKTLEDMLEIQLFDRIKQRLVPTPSAHQLYEKCRDSLNEIEKILSDIKGGTDKIIGQVTIGVPVEFGNNLIVPLLSKFGRENPNVKFNLKYEFVTVMTDLLLKGDVDFAFVDSFHLDDRITTERVYEEVLELCASQDFMKDLASGPVKDQRKYYESLDYVDYQPDEPVLRKWFQHHIGTHHLRLNVRATAMDVQGVARFISNGLGAGVLPGYLLDKFQKEGLRLFRFKGSGEPLKNPIQLAYLKGRSQSAAATTCMRWLSEQLKK